MFYKNPDTMTPEIYTSSNEPNLRKSYTQRKLVHENNKKRRAKRSRKNNRRRK